MSGIPWHALARLNGDNHFAGTLEQCVREFLDLTGKQRALATIDCDELVTAPGTTEATPKLVGPEIAALGMLLPRCFSA